MNEKEIRKLLQEYLKGTISSEDERKLETFEARVIAKNLEQLTGSEEAKQRVFKKINRAVKRSDNQRSIVSRSLKIAASITVFFTLGYLLMKPKVELQPAAEPIVWVEKTAEWGEKLNLSLPDGTQIKLNSGSHIKFPQSFTVNERRVELKGEAFFDVARNEEKPFIIESGDVQTTVLGTSFNINAYPEEDLVSVSVLTGRVRVTSASNNVYLTPNEQGVYSRSNGKITKGRVDIDRILFWKNGILHFEDASLKDVAKSLERWFGVEISIESKELMGCQVKDS